MCEFKRWEGMVAKPVTRESLEAQWSDRESMWRHKLGRLRLGVEPIEEQLGRYRRVTWVLTAIPLALSCFIVILFLVRGRSDVGAVVAAILLLPIVLGAWIDHAILVIRARSYLRERGEYLREWAQFAQKLPEHDGTRDSK